MYTLITVLIIVVCILLVMIVLIQDSKGGGLGSSFGASNQIIGVKRTADFVEKATWGLAVALLVLSLGVNLFIPRNTTETTGVGSRIDEQIEDAVVPTQMPNFDQVPVEGGSSPE